MSHSDCDFLEGDPPVGKHPDDVDFTRYDYPKAGFKAIRAKCLDCAFTAREVRLCVQYSCPLWPYRMGKNPKSLKTNRSGRFG